MALTTIGNTAFGNTLFITANTTISGPVTLSGATTSVTSGNLQFNDLGSQQINWGGSNAYITGQHTNAFLKLSAVGSIQFLNGGTEQGRWQSGGLVVGTLGGAGDGTLHVHTASAGSVTAATNADDLVVENSGASGISILTPNTVSGVISFGDPDDNDVARIFYVHPDNGMRFDTNGANALLINADGEFGVGAAPSGGKFYLLQDAAATRAFYNLCSSAAFTNNIFQLDTNTVAGTGFNFIECNSDVDGTLDREFYFRGDGNAFADGSWSGCGADYAEFFESNDGTALEVGRTVVLVGNKVRHATNADDPNDIIGVVRPKTMSGRGPLVRGNSAWNMWSGKYLIDDFGSYIMENYDVLEWTETVMEPDAADPAKDIPVVKKRSYAEDRIPAGMTPPVDAERISMQRRKLNPAWDSEADYTPREDRDEWALIGLLGQMPVTKGEPLGSRWIKQKDISVSVEEYLVR